MNHAEQAQLRSEMTALKQMLAETPDDEVLDRAGLQARLEAVESAIAELDVSSRAPAKVRLTFKGSPVVGSHGVFVDFGTKAAGGYAEAVSAMAAANDGPLALSGPIPNRAQHQLLITRTALGSFGFELEEHLNPQLELDSMGSLSFAIERVQELLAATLGSDDELADRAAEIDQRVLHKVRAFLTTLVDNNAVCSVRYGGSTIAFRDVGQVRAVIERLSDENLREERHEIAGELMGVLPQSRAFEFKGSDGAVIRGKIASSLRQPENLNLLLQQAVIATVAITTLARGRPRYVLYDVRRS